MNQRTDTPMDTTTDMPTNTVGAWGRWGAEDERGAVNHIGPEQVRRATGLVRSGEVLRLAQPLSPRTPVPSHRCGMQHFMGRDGGDYAAGAGRPGGFQFAEDTVIMPLHFGTHVDALCHAWTDDRLYNGYLGQTIRSTTGAQKLGIDKMPPIVTRGVLLDIVALHGGALDQGTPIGADDLRRAAAAAGVTPERGDAVLLRTGWLEFHAQGPKHDFNVEAGIDLSAAEWLLECEVAIVGADNFAVEVLPFAPGLVFPVHQKLIRDFGVPLLEGVDLAPLIGRGRAEFLFICSVLPIVGGTGSPVAPVAVL